MKHYCCDCGKLYRENEMILNKYHDGQDWYCKPCYKKLEKTLIEFYKKYDEWLNKQSTPYENGDLLRRNNV